MYSFFFFFFFIFKLYIIVLVLPNSGWGTHVYLWRIHFDIWQIKCILELTSPVSFCFCNVSAGYLKITYMASVGGSCCISVGQCWSGLCLCCL